MPIRLLTAATLLLCSATAIAAETETLRFDKPVAAVVNARRWDETQQQWMDRAEKAKPLFFDAIHRFLLVRFPGSAEAIHAKLGEGYRVQKAELALHWIDQEFLKAKGYHLRTNNYRNTPMPQCHARVHLLRRPWTDDAKLGPTWNAYVHTAGYWRGGGARDGFYDRYPEPLGDVGLWEAKPDGVLDVTAVLTDARFGDTLAARLRQVADCGFFIKKQELIHRGLAQRSGKFQAGALAPTRIWTRAPQLIVTLVKADEAAAPAPLPKPVDVPALAEKLQAAGGDGEPTTVIPTNLAELIAARRKRFDTMPDWMREHVMELRSIKHMARDVFLYYANFDDPKMADRQRYLDAVQTVLSYPPGYFLGHMHIDPVLSYIACRELWPDVVRYHLLKYMEARWQPPHDPELFHHRVAYFGGMSTLNLQTQARAELVLAAEQLGVSDLSIHATRALSLENRQMIFDDGAIGERGDSYYLGITLGNLQAVTRFSTDPLSRLKASMGVEMILFELNNTYHPALKRQVSTIARRKMVNNLILGQDAPRGILHTLSKRGVLIETDKLYIHGDPEMNARRKRGERIRAPKDVAKLGVRTSYFNPCSPERVIELAPWGRPWEFNAVDNKPIPFGCMATGYNRALLDNPYYFVNYMGTHYALASVHSAMGRQWPMQAVWRRADAEVTKLADLGILFIYDYMNGKPMVTVEDPYSVGRGATTNALYSMLQHKGKLIYAMRPTERKFSIDHVKRTGGGVTDVFSRVFIHSYGERQRQRVFINGRSAGQLPTTADFDDVITIRDGVAYVGLIPLTPAKLPRETAVQIHYDYPRLILDAYVLDPDEPLPVTDVTWRKLADATGGWLLEVADATEYDSFEAFQQHMQATTRKQRWDAEARTLHVAYTSGPDTLEMGFKTAFQRQELWKAVEPPDVVAYHRVNGERPYPPRGIDQDSPLGQSGKAARLEKNGAVLETVAGQPAVLKLEPITKTTEALNPFIDPSPLRLTTAEGIVVEAEGAIGCARITVRPTVNTLEVDYHLPPPTGDLGVELLQADAKAGKHGGKPQYEAKLSRFFRPGVDVTRAREQSARWLRVTGFQGAPTAVLNGQALPGPFTTLEIDGQTWYRIPVAPPF